MPHADCNGQRLYYEEHGAGEPLFCIHGLSASTLGWLPQIPAWSQQYRTIVFDNRDVGQSSRADGDYEIADMTADALALADALGLDTFHLLGLSMGGAIAQRLVLTAPERVRTLTLCVTFGGTGGWGLTHGRVWSERIPHMTREQRIDELMLLCFTEAFYEHADQVAFVRQALLAGPEQEPDAFVRQLLATTRHEVRDQLGALDLPVHVIGAEHDILVPVWKSQELAQLIPGARLTLLEGAAHGANLELAERFNAAVLDFLAAGAPA